jgi:hypothetical protein
VGDNIELWWSQIEGDAEREFDTTKEKEDFKRWAYDNPYSTIEEYKEVKINESKNGDSKR